MNMSEQTIELMLDHIIDDSALHARWLNTLSFLEHVGTRKIHKTQDSMKMTDMVLRHASEEARHAHFFKRMAERIDPSLTDSFDFRFMVSGFSAYKYFQKLDSMVEKYFLDRITDRRERAYVCYLYVTTLIEERAGWLYPIYEDRLQKKKSDITLSTVIGEEERHLSDMYTELARMDDLWEERLAHFREKEHLYYDMLFSTIRRDLIVEVA